MDGADGDLSNKSQMEDQFDDCKDNKVCIYETLISGGFIKAEPCDMEDEGGNILNYSNVKDENINDSIVRIQETGLIVDTKGNYVKHCEECGEEYDLYCLKCSMLIRIFDNNNPSPSHNRVRWTLPKNIIDICETPSAVGIIALRAIPKGVVFGPFEGLDSIKDGAVSKWRLKNNELAYIKDPKRLNWMQYIRRADPSCPQNLTTFQYEDTLYYRSDCHISMGDELLVCWNSDNEESMIEDSEHSYLKPQLCERLDDTYACTFCCVGYKSVCHLAAHNFSCSEKRNRKDFCKGIIQCAFCKIYLDEKEYSDYHIDRCCESNPKKYVTAPGSQGDTHKPEVKSKYKCSMCEYSTLRKNKFRQHLMTHADLRRYKCPKCPHQTTEKYRLKEHVRAHAKCSSSRYECEHCGDRFARSDLFAIHQKKKHSVSVYKCDKCVYETTNALDLRTHMATHKDDQPYPCKECGKQFRIHKSLVAHIRIYHNEKKKEYKCPKCDFETLYPGNMKNHMLNIHGGVQRYKCPRCSFKTSYKLTLDRHLRYHEDAKPLKCESCDIEYWNISSLVRHENKVHAIADETYSCCKCKYQTRNKYAFDRHLLRMHDGPKLFVCTLCPYKAMRNSTLNKHIATHSDHKPFKCGVCPKMFKQKSNLILHARHNHTEVEKDLQCPKRDVNARNESELFRCSKCDFNTYHKRGLASHIKRVHATKVKQEEPLIESDDL